MKCLNRQKIKIYYANEGEVTDVVDESGYYTGEKELVYTEPTAIYVTIGTKGGNISLQPFGSELDYDATIISDNVNCPINENSRIWVDNAVTEENDYVVKGINKTLNYVSYAIKRVQ